MIHAARDCPIPKDGALQRVLVGGLAPAPVALPSLGSPIREALDEAFEMNLVIIVVLVVPTDYIYLTYS